MALTLKLAVGSDLTLDRENLTIVRKFSIHGTLPFSGGGDAFDYVASYVMGAIQNGGTDPAGQAYGPTYQTPMGTLFWNSIQLHESHYAQLYDASVTYSPFDRQSGTYQVTVDQAVGNVHVTAGTLMASYPSATWPGSGGTFFDGDEIVGFDIPVPEDRITIQYRHPKAFLNWDYTRAVGKLRGYPNSDTFLGYAAGEVRYMGGNFSQTDCEATASYNFDISPNAPANTITVGGVTITAEKSGFDVIQPVYEPDTDTAGGETHAVRKVKGLDIIRPRAHKAYKSVFGWG